MAKGLKAILSSMEAKPTTIEFGDDTIDFYPVRLRAILKAQKVVQEMAKATVALFDPNGDDYTKRVIAKQKVNLAEGDEEAENVDVESTTIEAISPVHAKERIKRREASIVDGLGTLLDEENIDRVLLLIEDSSRGACEADDMKDLGFDMLFPLLRGMMKANFSVFGGALGKAMSRVETKLGDALDDSEEQAE